MRIAVTGSTGQLGRAVTAAARAAGHEVVGLSRREPEPCDLTDRAAVERCFDERPPALVVHAAGATDVDGCERDPAAARRLNVDATRHVVAAAARHGAHVVYVSTNHVFDGSLDRPYATDDVPNPPSVYGATKLEGERLVGPEATIVRTAWLSSTFGPNLVTAVLDAARTSGPLRFVTDERAQPTFAADLADAVLRLGAARAPGTWHVVNEGPVSAYELAREVLAAAGDDPDRVQAIGAAALPGRRARRPRNGVLDTGRLAREGGGALPHHAAALAAVVAALTTP